MTLMSHDLLELDAFYQPPSKQSFEQPSPQPPRPSKPFAPIQDAAQFERGHRQRASATTFDDLLGIMNTGLVPSKPKPAVSTVQWQDRRRPASVFGQSSFGLGPTLDDSYSSGAFDLRPAQSNTHGVLEGDGGDDFGSFQTAPAPALPQPAQRWSPSAHSHSQSLLVDFAPTASPLSPPPPPSQPQERPSLPKLESSPNADDDFGDFVAPPATRKAFQFPPPAQPQPQPQPPPGRSPALKPLAFSASPLQVSKKLPQISDEFPPAAALLQTLSPLFSLPQDHLLEQLKGLPFPLRQRVLSDPKTKEFLEGVCELGRVAGRIIAGRRRRTKPFPANRRSGGMKLAAGGSRAIFEAQKEDREVKETCRLWKEGMGRIKAAMREVVPELKDERRGPAVGEPTCKLCRLGKTELIRDLREKKERIGFWDAEWGGHGSCRAFWDKHGKEARAAKY